MKKIILLLLLALSCAQDDTQTVDYTKHYEGYCNLFREDSLIGFTTKAQADVSPDGRTLVLHFNHDNHDTYTLSINNNTFEYKGEMTNFELSGQITDQRVQGVWSIKDSTVVRQGNFWAINN